MLPAPSFHFLDFFFTFFAGLAISASFGAIFFFAFFGIFTLHFSAFGMNGKPLNHQPQAKPHERHTREHDPSPAGLAALVEVVEVFVEVGHFSAASKNFRKLSAHCDFASSLPWS